MNSNRKYRREFWDFRTSSGVRKICICVLSGDNERARMIAKGEEMAKKYGWKLL